MFSQIRHFPSCAAQKNNKTKTNNYQNHPFYILFSMIRLSKSPYCEETAKNEAYNQHINCKCTKDQVEDFVRKYIREERRKVDQAKLAVDLDRITARRLMEGLRQSDTTDTCSDRTSIHKRKFVKRMKKKKKSAGTKDCFDPKLQMDKNPAELTVVTIIPNQGGETIIGTLEAHAHGFVYATSNSHMHFMYRDVEEAFIRVEDEKIKMPSLLHFHLKHPIKVGKEKTKDIQFRLVSTPVGQSRADNDSKKIETRVRGTEFKINGVQFDPFNFDNLDKTDEFHGVLLPSKEMVVFGLPLFSLVVFADTAPFMVKIRDIEIVHLAKLRPGEIDMTVIFKDFKSDLLQINSIPLDSLDDFKAGLNIRYVKYYVNAEKRDWKSIMKGIGDSPETFIKQGGWKFFDLEDPPTIRYYLHYILEEFKPKKWHSSDDEWD
ncbi:hypothetical protein MKX03_006569 [Papaver bracteatum]|nr:hypothetical protein MKX03_006569 [Papaver bracteatum]